jgi:hypothetical protein
MTPRLRHCVECPSCRTRYLLGFSPYSNGGYLLPIVPESRDEWTLYCFCDRPPVASRWRWNELKRYEVSNRAHEQGYGTPQEIVRAGNSSQSIA